VGAPSRSESGGFFAPISADRQRISRRVRGRQRRLRNPICRGERRVAGLEPVRDPPPIN